MGEVTFAVLARTGSMKRQRMKFYYCVLHCRQNLKNQNSTLSFSGLRQKIAPKSVQHVQNDYFSSFNRSKHCSIQKKPQIQLVVRDTMNSICPMNFFRTTGTTDTTDTTIWKPGFKLSSEQMVAVICDGTRRSFENSKEM